MSAQRRAFDPKVFLSTTGPGREMMFFRKGQPICAQGDVPDALFVIQQGTIKLSIESKIGREATLDILGAGDFVGIDAVAEEPVRIASAYGMTDCILLRIKKRSMMLALKRHAALAKIFWAYVLARSIRYQKDLGAQRCNPSQERLARILLLLAHPDHGPTKTTIPRISHATLAEMVGTTRSRVCHFMKGFKDTGLISYDRRGEELQVHRSLAAFCARQFR